MSVADSDYPAHRSYLKRTLPLSKSGPSFEFESAERFEGALDLSVAKLARREVSNVVFKLVEVR